MPRRLVTTVAVSFFLVIAILGGGTVSAAGNSLPGSPLYGVKRATEAIVGATTFTPRQRSQLHLHWADRRLDEVKALLDQDEDIATSLLEDLDRETEQALIFAEEAGAESLTTFAAQVEQQQEALQQLLVEAPQPAQSGLEKALNASTRRGVRAQQALNGAAGDPPSEAPDTLPAAKTPEAETGVPATQPTTKPPTPEPADQAPANGAQDTLPAGDNSPGPGIDEKTPPGHDPAHNPNSGQNSAQPPNRPENQGQDSERGSGQGQQDKDPPGQGGGPPQNPGQESEQKPDQPPGQDDPPGQGSGQDKGKGKDGP